MWLGEWLTSTRYWGERRRRQRTRVRQQDSHHRQYDGFNLYISNVAIRIATVTTPGTYDIYAGVPGTLALQVLWVINGCLQGAAPN